MLAPSKIDSTRRTVNNSAEALQTSLILYWSTDRDFLPINLNFDYQAHYLSHYFLEIRYLHCVLVNIKLAKSACEGCSLIRRSRRFIRSLRPTSRNSISKSAYLSNSFKSMKQKILRYLRDSTPLIGLIIRILLRKFASLLNHVNDFGSLY